MGWGLGTRRFSGGHSGVGAHERGNFQGQRTKGLRHALLGDGRPRPQRTAVFGGPPVLRRLRRLPLRSAYYLPYAAAGKARLPHVPQALPRLSNKCAVCSSYAPPPHPFEPIT